MLEIVQRYMILGIHLYSRPRYRFSELAEVLARSSRYFSIIYKQILFIYDFYLCPLVLHVIGSVGRILNR